MLTDKKLFVIISTDQESTPKQEGMKMTARERFIKVQVARGYEVKELKNVVILNHGNYTATWFFKADGSLDKNNKPSWSTRKYK